MVARFLFRYVTIPLVIFCLFFVVSLFSRVVNGVNIFVQECVGVSVIVPRSSTSKSGVVELVDHGPGRSNNKAMMFERWR